MVLKSGSLRSNRALKNILGGGWYLVWESVPNVFGRSFVEGGWSRAIIEGQTAMTFSSLRCDMLRILYLRGSPLHVTL